MGMIDRFRPSRFLARQTVDIRDVVVQSRVEGRVEIQEDNERVLGHVKDEIIGLISAAETAIIASFRTRVDERFAEVGRRLDELHAQSRDGTERFQQDVMEAVSRSEARTRETLLKHVDERVAYLSQRLDALQIEARVGTADLRQTTLGLTSEVATQISFFLRDLEWVVAGRSSTLDEHLQVASPPRAPARADGTPSL